MVSSRPTPDPRTPRRHRGQLRKLGIKDRRAKAERNRRRGRSSQR